jgi:hypothetical protein
MQRLQSDDLLRHDGMLTGTYLLPLLLLLLLLLPLLLPSSSPPPAAAAALERASRSLARGSRMDVAETMALGRMSRMRGDGTLELVPIPADRALGALSTTSSDSTGSAATFSVQGFVDAAGVSWAKSSTLMKLVTLAAVCNKAKYDMGDASGKEGSHHDKKHVAVPMLPGGPEDRKVLGDATDTGLLRYVDKLSSAAVLRMAYKKVRRRAGRSGLRA